MSYQTFGVTGLTSSNKIPEYAREYKREYLFIRSLNKEFEYFINFMRYDDVEYKPHKVDRIMGFVKTFLRAQQKGRLKDISDFEFDYDDIYNIIKFKKNLPEYYYIIQNLHDWSKYEYDGKTTVSRYEIYKHDLELFLSNFNDEFDYGESDSEIESDYEIEIQYSDDDSE